MRLTLLLVFLSALGFLVAAAGVFSWVLIYGQVPQTVAVWIESVAKTPITFMLLVMLILLLVGTVIDHGPYSASMSGEYDKETKTIHWMTKAKEPNGKPMVQKTSITQKSANERVLVMSVPGENENEFNKIMQIRFVKRK